MAFTTHDNAPYLYRRSGGGGDKEIDKLVGGTIAWNQLIKNGNFADTSNWSTWGGTITVSGNVATVTTPGQWSQLSQVFDWTYGHIMLAMASVKKFGESGSISVKVVNDFAYSNQQFTKGIATNDVWTNVVFCGTYTKTPSDSTARVRFGVQEYRPSNSNNGFQIKNAMVCDLTLMFGSTIADYVYSLEQSSQGSGLAWLRSYGFFTEDYYDYNSGELKSVSNLVSHDMTGEDASTTLHSYPLGDVTLRGLPKLNGNALYYDGDTYESNGTVTRKYGVVDLGTLNWGYRAADSSKPYPQEYATLSGAVSGRSTNVVCPKYSASQEPVRGRTVDKTICTFNGAVYVSDSSYSTASEFKTAMSGVYLVYELASSTTETADPYTNPQWVDPNGTERYTLSANAFPMPVGHETTYNTDMGSKTVNTQVNLSMTEPFVRQVYAKEGDTARVLNIHLDQTEEDGTLRILRPDGTEVTAEAVLVPEFYDGLMAEIPPDATSIVGKCYCDVEQNGVSSMPFTLNVKKNERAT